MTRCYVPIMRGEGYAVGLAQFGQRTIDLNGPCYATAGEAKAIAHGKNRRRYLWGVLGRLAMRGLVLLAVLGVVLVATRSEWQKLL